MEKFRNHELQAYYLQFKFGQQNEAMKSDLAQAGIETDYLKTLCLDLKIESHLLVSTSE